MPTIDGISSIDEELSAKDVAIDGEELGHFENSFGEKAELNIEPQIDADENPQIIVESQKSKGDSEISIDHIELSVNHIKTENLQWMKEKPIITLIK